MAHILGFIIKRQPGSASADHVHTTTRAHFIAALPLLQSPQVVGFSPFHFSFSFHLPVPVALAVLLPLFCSVCSPARRVRVALGGCYGIRC